MTPARLAFLVNDLAREGRAGARLARLLGRNPALAARSRVLRARSPAEARGTVAGLADGEWPVAAGGDGTVNLVARALRDAGVADRPLAILPLGTGNAVAHALGVGTPALALAALEGGREARLDLLATDRPEAPLALCSVSAGFEGRLVAGLGLGRGAWRAVGLVAGLPRAAATRGGLSLEAAGRVLCAPEEPAFNAGLYNLPHYAFGWIVHPDADGADGVAEAVVHTSAGSWLRALRRGLPTARPGSGPARTARFARARLASAGPLQVDGDRLRAGAIEVAVLPGALRVVTGEGAAVSGGRPGGGAPPGPWRG